MPGVWIHLVGVHNRSGNIVYINGVERGRDSYIVESGIADSNDLMVIGGSHNQDGRYMWDGTIDEVMVYPRALSADEILEIYNGQAGGVPSISPLQKIWRRVKNIFN